MNIGVEAATGTGQLMELKTVNTIIIKTLE